MDHSLPRGERADAVVPQRCSPGPRAPSPPSVHPTPASRFPHRRPDAHNLPVARYCCLLFAAGLTVLALARPPLVGATTRGADPDVLRADPRLRPTLTVRVSRTPMTELLERMSDALGVRLLAEGEDVSDQKIDLFVRDLPGFEILTAITNLLNSEGPKGYRWDRSGPGPGYRYVLVRDVASRQWEAQRTRETEGRLAGLLRDRLRALRSEPFRPRPDRPLELPAMRKLLCALTGAQVTKLAAERFLNLSALYDSNPSPLWKELCDQAVEAETRRDPNGVPHKIAWATPSDLVSRTRVQIRLLGDPARYRVHVGVSTPAGGGMSEICRFSDPAATRRTPARPAGDPPAAFARDPDPTFALPPRTSWLMGDVLADIAARAGVNLIADDYTQQWPELARLRGPQPLSRWLETIREEYGFEPTRDGAFLRLRNRRWWSDRQREVPRRLVTRWAELTQGSPADRLEALREIAGSVPLSHGFSPTRDRLAPLRESPEMMELVPNPTDPERYEFVNAAAWLQTELRIYDLLAPSQQKAIREEGLTLMWDRMPSAIRELFARQMLDYWEPGIPAAKLRGSGIWLRFSGDRLSARYMLQDEPPGRAERRRHEYDTTPARPVRTAGLAGQPAPELLLETEAGQKAPWQPRGPLLLYLTPAWPRPVVTQKEEFADLRALEALQEGEAEGERRVQVVGTDATVAELREWWKARGLTLPPVAAAGETARRYGVRTQPVAAVVDRSGRVTWVKEGNAPGDEDEWRRQLEQVRE